MRKISLLFGLLAGMTGAGFGAEPIRLDWGDLDTSGAAQQQAVRALRGRAVRRRCSGGAARMASWLVQFDGVIQAEWRRRWRRRGRRLRVYAGERFSVSGGAGGYPRDCGVGACDVGGEFLPEYKRAAQVRRGWPR